MNGARGWLAFIGVFAPSVLGLLGVVLTMRLGWVVAQGGLLGALAVVGLAHAIALVTALSMSALATNARLGMGGAYFLVSRSVGLEIGGPLGLPLFVAQALGLTLCAYGIGELVAGAWGDAPVPLIAGLVVAGATAVHPHTAPRIRWLWLPAVVGTIVAGGGLVLGADWGSSQVDAVGPWEGAGFWAVFAVFFPAMTGVLHGLALAEDDEVPEHVMPRGAVGAALAGLITTVVFVVALSASGGAEALSAPTAWVDVAAGGPIVAVGIAVALAFGALAALAGAHRTLAALAADGLAPLSLAVPELGSRPSLGALTTGGVALFAVALGGLDEVAWLTTALGLTTFGALNLSAALEGLVGDTGFRPRVRVPWGVSLAGAVACAVGLAMVAPGVGLVLIGGLFVAFWVLSRRSLEATFGDVRSGLLLSLARALLIRLGTARVDARNWRPHILVFTSDVQRALPVLRCAATLGHHRGLVTVAHLVERGTVGAGAAEALERLRRSDDQVIRDAGIKAFCEVVAVPDLDRGAIVVAQASGMIGLRSNTALFGYRAAEQGPEQLARLLRLGRELAELEKCVLLHVPGDAPAGGPVVVWWAGRENHGDLMLLLAHLVTRASGRRPPPIQLKNVAEDGPSAREVERDFEGMLPTFRIPVTVEVLIRGEDESVQDVIARESAGASMVFLGLPLGDPARAEAQAASLDALVRRLPPTCLVHNAGPFRGRLV